MLAFTWPQAFDKDYICIKRCLPQMTRPSSCTARTYIFLDQFNKDKFLHFSEETTKLLGKKPDKLEDVEKIILFVPKCTLWIRRSPDIEDN